MKKWILIGITTLLLLAGGLLFFARQQPNTLAENTIVESIDDIPDNVAALAIAQKLSEAGLHYMASDFTIENSDTVDGSWLIVDAINTSLPEDSEARVMRYVIEVIDSKATVVAYSGDGFSANSFPDETPQTIVDKANTYE